MYVAGQRRAVRTVSVRWAVFLTPRRRRHRPRRNFVAVWFAFPWGFPRLYNLVSGLQEDASITGWHLGVHLMRHSFATNYLRNSGGVFQLQHILGHASIATTVRYVKLAAVDVKMDHSRTSLAKALGLIRE